MNTAEPALDYRDVLKDELQTRLKKNPRYSLRAFARDLEMTPQMLSAVLNAKKDISLDTAAEIATRLGFDPNRTQDFLDALIMGNCKSPLARGLIRQRIEERNHAPQGFKSLTLEMFKAIADWQHLALLELTTTQDFKSDVRWIAARLGLSVHEVKEAIARLNALELLEEIDGRLVKTELDVSALSEVPASALREHARQVLNKALKALDDQTQSERDVTSMTMAVDPKLLPEAKKMILQFRRRLCKFLESGQRSEIYVFAPALFRLTQKNRSRS